MSDGLDRRIKQLFEELDRVSPEAPPTPTESEVPDLPGGPGRMRRAQGWMIGVAAAAFVVLAFGLVGLLPQGDEGATDTTDSAAQPTETTVAADATATTLFVPDLAPDASGASPTAGTPLPDVEGAVLGDDGEGPLPLGTVTTIPDSVRLDFLFEFCSGDVCWRDAHFIDPDRPDMGSGQFTAGMPFHIRHGFVNEGEEPLGEGFDVVVYVTEIDTVGESGGEGVGETFRYTADYVVRGEAEACGPTYRNQTGPVTCEWFVHEFEDGLPVGRHALWVMWEAPCSAWIDYGFTETCTDPNQILSLFTSGVDSPFSTLPPNYDETSYR